MPDLVRAVCVLFTPLWLLMPAVARAQSHGAIECSRLAPPNAQDIETSVTPRVGITIDGLFRKLAGATLDVDGTYRSVQRDTLKEYKNAAGAFIWARVLYLQCQLLSASTQPPEVKDQQFKDLLFRSNQTPPVLGEKCTHQETTGNGTWENQTKTQCKFDEPKVVYRHTLFNVDLINGPSASGQFCQRAGFRIAVANSKRSQDSGTAVDVTDDPDNDRFYQGTANRSVFGSITCRY